MRRDGNPRNRTDGSQVFGPFTLAVRRTILDRLFALEKTVGDTLITPDEIECIEDVWWRDEIGRTRPTRATSIRKRFMTQITSEVLLVSQLFLKGRFTVPWHQRQYDWTVEQVTELLVDLKEALDEDRRSYFLGSIMLVAGEKVWEINDGQQRLITLSLLFAAFGRRFARNRETDAGREMLALRVLFDRPANAVSNFDDTTREVPRIEPPRQDRSRFTQIIRGRDIGTNGKLTSAWNEVALFVSAMGPHETQTFFDFLMQKVEIGVLYVPQTEDANAVFEALNGAWQTAGRMWI